MNNIEKLINYICSIVNSGLYKYSQDGSKRWGDGYYDCSSLMITGLRYIGIRQADKMTYTGNMITCKNDDQIENIPFNSSDVRTGDILLYHKNGNIGHTGLYIGNGKIAHAKSTRDGLVISSYYSTNWTNILRVKPDNNESNNYKVLLSKGAKGYKVKKLQLFLKECVDSSIDIDGSYGNKTANAVYQMYINCNVSPRNYLDEQGQKFIDETERRLK